MTFTPEQARRMLPEVTGATPRNPQHAAVLARIRRQLEVETRRAIEAAAVDRGACSATGMPPLRGCAARALARSKRRMAAYACPFCGAWHVAEATAEGKPGRRASE